MNTSGNLQDYAVDDLIRDAIHREKTILEFYNSVRGEVGPEAGTLMMRFTIQQKERILLLENLLREIRELRDLTLAMVD